MKTDVFVARLARGAAATAMASAWLLPDSQVVAAASSSPAQEAVSFDAASLHGATSFSNAHNSVVLTVTPSASEWDKKMEREFRALALKEAEGRISPGEAGRLEELNRWRNQLLKAPTTEEILLQLKRDRLLTRMEALLKEYVEFKEGASQKRAAT